MNYASSGRGERNHEKNYLGPGRFLLNPIGFGGPCLADTIRLKDGSVIHGQVLGFKDQQFTILVGGGARGRRSSITIFMEDVESIDFDRHRATLLRVRVMKIPDHPRALQNQSHGHLVPVPHLRPTAEQLRAGQLLNRHRAAPTFFTIKVTVRADNVNNGWSNTGLVVRRGQRLGVTASGRVDLGKRAVVRQHRRPIHTVVDEDRLMRSEPTAVLIAVIGDDNDDFIVHWRTDANLYRTVTASSFWELTKET